MPPIHHILNSVILPVALKLADGSYLASADQALGLWNRLTVVQLESTLDPHFASWGLFVLGEDGKPERYLVVCDDFHSVQAIQESLSVENPPVDAAGES
jgi:hypothetical protein